MIKKQSFPLERVREHLETGPIVLVSSAWRGKTNIMTMGWHMMMEFTPALFACVISSGNHSFDLVRKSKECVINVPTLDLAEAVVGIGNTSGAKLDKFDEFGLTRVGAEQVSAPLIAECYANFECKLHDEAMIERYNLFIWEIVAAHVAPVPKNPKTIHYRGRGHFMTAGKTIDLSEKFRPEMLGP